MNISYLRVGISPWYFMKAECLSGNNVKCDPGMELEIISIVCTMLNLSLQIIYSKESGCGMKSSGENRWTGLLGMLQKGEIDMTGNLCDVFDERVAEFDVSYPVLQQKQAFLLKLPAPLPSAFNPLAPFTVPSWYMLSFLMFVFLITDSLYRYAREAKGNWFQSILVGMHDIQAICFQFQDTPRYIYWICFVIVISAMKIAYTNYIIAALMQPSPVWAPFKNVDELAHSVYTGKYRLAHYHKDPLAALPTCLPESCERLLQALNKTSLHHIADSKPQSILKELTEHENLVIINGNYLLQTYLREFKRRSDLWMVLDEHTGVKYSAYMWRKKFALKEQINRALISLGDVNKNIGKKYAGLVEGSVNCKAYVQEDTTVLLHSLPLLSLTGPLKTVTISISLAIFVFFIELVHYKISNVVVHFLLTNYTIRTTFVNFF
ncbi:hypothetical protein T09_6065 [Trichinella sp. T9]|nr:hypothetical protein T09_6065 [Trichinella sp. T9]